MPKYYSLSLKHTNKKDDWFTFERVGGRGYCWFREWADCSPEESEITVLIYRHKDTLAIREDIIKDLWIHVLYEKEVRHVVFINPANLSTLNILKRDLQAPWRTNLGDYEIVTQDTIDKTFNAAVALLKTKPTHL